MSCVLTTLPGKAARFPDEKCPCETIRITGEALQEAVDRLLQDGLWREKVSQACALFLGDSETHGQMLARLVSLKVEMDAAAHRLAALDWHSDQVL